MRYMAFLVLMLIILVPLRAGAVQGDKVIYGQVYKSDHTVAQGYEGTYVAIIVTHNGTNQTYLDPNGLDSQGWYSITLPSEDRGDGWDVGDTFRVWVDGTPWGDGNWSAHNATGGGENHTYQEINFTIDNNTVQRQDVETLTISEVPESPLLMLAFIAILISVGFKRWRKREGL